MFYGEHRGKVVGEIRDFLKSTSYVRDYLTEIRPSVSQNAWSKDKLIIRIWLNKDLKDAEDVTLTLAGLETLEEKIKRIADQARLSVMFDIYNV